MSNIADNPATSAPLLPQPGVDHAATNKLQRIKVSRFAQKRKLGVRLQEEKDAATAALAAANAALEADNATMMVTYDEDAVQSSLAMLKTYRATVDESVSTASDICGPEVWDFTLERVSAVWNFVDDKCSFKSFAKLLYHAVHTAPSTEQMAASFNPNALAWWTEQVDSYIRTIVGEQPKGTVRSELDVEMLKYRLSCAVVCEYYLTLHQLWSKLHPIPPALLSDNHVTTTAATKEVAKSPSHSLTIPPLVRKSYRAKFTISTDQGCFMTMVNGERSTACIVLLSYLVEYEECTMDPSTDQAAAGATADVTGNATADSKAGPTADGRNDKNDSPIQASTTSTTPTKEFLHASLVAQMQEHFGDILDSSDDEANGEAKDEDGNDKNDAPVQASIAASPAPTKEDLHASLVAQLREHLGDNFLDCSDDEADESPPSSKRAKL